MDNVLSRFSSSLFIVSIQHVRHVTFKGYE